MSKAETIWFQIENKGKLALRRADIRAVSHQASGILVQAGEWVLQIDPKDVLSPRGVDPESELEGFVDGLLGFAKEELVGQEELGSFHRPIFAVKPIVPWPIPFPGETPDSDSRPSKKKGKSSKTKGVSIIGQKMD